MTTMNNTRASLWAAWLAVAALATACGGGGDGAAAPAASSPATSPSPVPPPPSANAVERAYNEGVHALWGFGLVLNGVQQVFVSRQTLSSGALVSTKVAGATTSPETPPSLLDGVSESVNYLSAAGTTSTCTPYLSFAGSTETAQVACSASASSRPWAVRLLAEDVAGRTVSGYVRNGVGAAPSGVTLNASTVFPAGALAYTAELTAQQDMVVYDLRNYFVTSTNMVGRGWCERVPGQTYSLATVPHSDKTVSFFDVASGCDTTGLTPVATGSWEDIAPTGSYRVIVPEALRSNARWVALFTNSYSPTKKMFDVVYFNNSGVVTLGSRVRAGERFVSLQPHFNAAAVPALKAAANLP